MLDLTPLQLSACTQGPQLQRRPPAFLRLPTLCNLPGGEAQVLGRALLADIGNESSQRVHVDPVRLLCASLFLHLARNVFAVKTQQMSM